MAKRIKVRYSKASSTAAVGTDAAATPAPKKAYAVQIKESARRELDRIPAKHRKQVEDRIEGLTEDPRPAGWKALKGKEFKGLARIKSGEYRIIYCIEDAKVIVTVVSVGNRKDVYR